MSGEAFAVMVELEEQALPRPGTWWWLLTTDGMVVFFKCPTCESHCSVKGHRVGPTGEVLSEVACSRMRRKNCAWKGRVWLKNWPGRICH